jgi:hypothetical protein
VRRDQLLVVAEQHVGAAAVAQADFAGLQIQPAQRVPSRADAVEKFAEPGARPERLEDELDRAAAGQAEAERLVGGDAVLHALGPLGRHLAAAHLVDEVVLDAAAGDRADHQSVVAHQHVRADRPRRRTPGAHHRAEHGAVSRRAPLLGLLQNLCVDVVHAVLRSARIDCSDSRRAILPVASQERVRDFVRLALSNTDAVQSLRPAQQARASSGRSLARREEIPRRHRCA